MAANESKLKGFSPPINRHWFYFKVGAIAQPTAYSSTYNEVIRMVENHHKGNKMAENFLGSITQNTALLDFLAYIDLKKERPDYTKKTMQYLYCRSRRVIWDAAILATDRIERITAEKDKLYGIYKEPDISKKHKDEIAQEIRDLNNEYNKYDNINSQLQALAKFWHPDADKDGVDPADNPMPNNGYLIRTLSKSYPR